eukprot:1398839-Amphidinium_carterae.1
MMKIVLPFQAQIRCCEQICSFWSEAGFLRSLCALDNSSQPYTVVTDMIMKKFSWQANSACKDLFCNVRYLPLALQRKPFANWKR